MFEASAEIAVRQWLHIYRQSPKTTIGATIFGLAIGGTSIFFVTQRDQAIREARRLENQNYTKQIERLDDTKRNLQTLIEFVDSQRSQLRLSEQALQSLKSEHDRLKPVVDTDRRAIDALFAAQEARNQAALSTERWIGVGYGVLSSLVASFLWSLGAYIIRRRRRETAA